MKNIISLLKLARYPNLIYIILTQCGIQYLIVLPALHRYGLESTLNHFNFSLLVLSTVFIAAAGYIINDYFDVNIDAVNKPEKLYIDKTIKRRHAIILHWVFNTIGVLIGVYLAWQVGNIKLLLVQPIAAAFLWFYSTGYKKQPFIGNLVVSFLTAFVVIMVVLYQTPLFNYNDTIIRVAAFPIFIRIFYYFVFAFLVSMMREIVKDMEDIEGDEKYFCRTLPIVIGIPKSKWIVYFFAIIVFGLVMTVQKGPYLAKDYLTVIYLMQTIQLPLAIAMWFLYNADSQKKFRSVSMLIKLVMLMGILSMAYLYFLLS